MAVIIVKGSKMDLSSVMQNIENIRNSELKDVKANKEDEHETDGVGAQTIDDYSKQAFIRNRTLKKPVHHGARGKVFLFTDLLVNGDKARRIKGLKKDYAEVKSEMSWNKDLRPELVAPIAERYMEEKFLPVVEAIIMQTSPEELYNSSKSLALLDKYVILSAKSGGSGYTKQYIKTAYLDRGIFTSGEYSSPEIIEGIQKLRNLSSQVENRTVYLLAKRLKERVDTGKTMATGDDYALLSRIVSFYN